MRYMLLIYEDEAAAAQATQEEQEIAYVDYANYTEEVKNRGILLAGDALMPTHTATTVRVRDGKILTTDGPFAETKEQLGGFYMLNCKDLDEATELAAKIPGARRGSVEIRPVAEFEGDQREGHGRYGARDRGTHLSTGIGPDPRYLDQHCGGLRGGRGRAAGCATRRT